MSRNRTMAFIASVVLAALAVGCQTTTTHTNANGNTAVVAINNNARVATNTNTATANINRSISREEYERNKERHQQEAKESGSRVGNGAEDLWLWTKTRADLLAARGLTSTGIHVDVENGVITLRGTVPDAAQKTRAEEVAKAVEGNKGVRDQLTIPAAGENADSANHNASANGNTNRNTNTKH